MRTAKQLRFAYQTCTRLSCHVYSWNALARKAMQLRLQYEPLAETNDMHRKHLQSGASGSSDVSARVSEADLCRHPRVHGDGTQKHLCLPDKSAHTLHDCAARVVCPSSSQGRNTSPPRRGTLRTTPARQETQILPKLCSSRASPAPDNAPLRGRRGRTGRGPATEFARDTFNGQHAWPQDCVHQIARPPPPGVLPNCDVP